MRNLTEKEVKKVKSGKCPKCNGEIRHPDEKRYNISNITWGRALILKHTCRFCNKPYYETFFVNPLGWSTTGRK